MKIIFLAYREWSLAVYQSVKKHPKVIESTLCKTSEELNSLPLENYDLLITCGWSNELGNEVVEKINAIGVHCAELDRYSYGTPIQLQIIDGIKLSKHRIFSFTYSADSRRAHTHNRLYSHEVDLDLSGNMDDILEQMTVTSKVLFDMYLNDFPNITWKKWPEEDLVRSKRKPEDSRLTKEQLNDMNTEQLYNFFRCLEDPYPNGYIEDEKGKLYINKVSFKQKHGEDLSVKQKYEEDLSVKQKSLKDLIILGAGGTAFEVIEIVFAINKVQPEWNILGYLDDNEELLGQVKNGYPVLGTIPQSVNYKNAYFASSIGNAYDTKLRMKVRNKVPYPDERFATLIHPNATICETAEIEPGAIIYSNVCVSANTHIGHDAFLVYNTVVAHESTIGKHCILSVGVFLPSDVHVGDCCYLGAGVASRHQMDIGDNCLIGMGTKIVKSVPSNSKLINRLENVITVIE